PAAAVGGVLRRLRLRVLRARPVELRAAGPGGAHDRPPRDLRGRAASRGARIAPPATDGGGPKVGQPVAPDVEAWFRQDRFQGEPHLVAQWADAHNALAQAWPKADPLNTAFVDEWAKAHPEAVAQFVKDNPATPAPAATDLAVVFFE